MICLLCNRQMIFQPKFSDLFFLKVLAQEICENCLETFELIQDNHCPNCYKSGNSNVCTDCKNWQQGAVTINHSAIFTYNTAMQDYFSQYKFVGDYRLRKIFQPFIRQELKKFKNYTVVPLPVSPERFQERGFNQVKGLLEGLNYQNLLEKTDSIKQSSLNRQERLASANTFYLPNPTNLPDRILLIDDIYTTGATLVHASQLLKSAGVHEIRTFSLCR